MRQASESSHCDVAILPDFGSVQRGKPVREAEEKNTEFRKRNVDNAVSMILKAKVNFKTAEKLSSARSIIGITEDVRYGMPDA